MPDARASAPPSTLAIDLQAPLPPELAGRGHGWLTRYRRYPVFSAPWVRARALGLGLLIITAAAFVLGGAVMAAGSETQPWGAMLQMMLDVAIPLFAGPWLGGLVRRRCWPARRELAALAALMLALVLGVAAFNRWAAEPIKQRIAEWTGAVDEQGKRKRVALVVGVSVGTPDQAHANAAAGRLDPGNVELASEVSSAVSIGLLTFVLAGGFALPRLAREREGLAALARERELARAEAARREAEMRLSVLAAQVEPHFLFNTLASVRSAIATDPPRASELVDRLADYLRASIPRLRSDGAAESTLGSQIEIVRAYLSLMVARMPRLAFTIDVPQHLLEAPFPPLMLISLAENAVKHGAEPKVGPVQIELRARALDDGRLQVSVSDDGVGFGAAAAGGGAAAGTGIGLQNIRERLAQMHGERAGLELRARAGGGVEASLVVPRA